jgi:hypothetical protein
VPKYLYFSPVQVKNKTCDRDSDHAFLLGPYSTVVNTTTYDCHKATIVRINLLYKYGDGKYVYGLTRLFLKKKKKQ